MNLAGIALRNVRQRLMSSTLTTVSVLLGTGLVAFLWLAARQAEDSYQRAYMGFPVVIGPKEMSPLSIVLNTVYHKGVSQGVVPLSLYDEVHDGQWKRKLGTRFAIPFVVGDSYRGFRLVGTTSDLFTEFGYDRNEDRSVVPLAFSAGGPFGFSHADLLAEAERQSAWSKARLAGEDGVVPHPPVEWRKVVLGAKAARQLGLKVGDKVVPTHGVDGAFEQHEEAACEVVGILEPTGTPTDAVLWMPIGLFYRIEGHLASGRPEGYEPGDVEISSLVADFKSPVGGLRLRRELLRRSDGQAVIPRLEITQLFDVVGDITASLRAIAWLVVIVSALGVFNSIYQTMFERRRTVAIQRALGARRVQIFSIVLWEALLITGIGALAGILCAHAAAGLFGPWFEARTRVALVWSDFAVEELVLALGVTLLGGLAGILPAWRIARIHVSEGLAPQ